MIKNQNIGTSWQKVSRQYDASVGEAGSYYHQTLIIPGVLKLLNLKPGDKVLDLACGQGVLSRYLPKDIYYLGIDLSEDLIRSARNQNKNPRAHFTKLDITKPMPQVDRDFTHAVIILALQNVSDPASVIKNAAEHLTHNGKLVIVLNHPCFRIPRQSSWGIDKDKKLEYRRVDRYLTPLKIPIRMQPSKAEKGPITWSFHQPLSAYSKTLSEAGFLIEKIEEWASTRSSEGRWAKMENRARSEFPLFLAVSAIAH